MKTLDQRLAWLAGVIDGEGTVGACLTVNSTSRKDGTRHRHLMFRVAIANTDEAMIREVAEIADTLGVRYCLHISPSRVTKHKPAFVISLSSWTRVEGLLNAVLPWLVTKRARADLVLAMIRHRRATARRRGMPIGTPPLLNDVWLMRQLGTLKVMNQRCRQPEEHDVVGS